MNAIIERAAQLVTEIGVALDASAFADRARITITSDGRDVGKAFTLEAGAVVVYPSPEIDWIAPRTAHLRWSIGVLASNPERTQDLVAALYSGKVVRFGDKATPTDFQMPDAKTIPGYTITHIEEHRP